MAMGWGNDDDEAYDRARDKHGTMRFMPKHRFLETRRRAREITDGTTLGTFERDEKVWDAVKEIKDKE